MFLRNCSHSISRDTDDVLPAEADANPNSDQPRYRVYSGDRTGGVYTAINRDTWRLEARNIHLNLLANVRFSFDLSGLG